MSAMFTRHALENMRESDVKKNDFHHLFDVLETVKTAADVRSILGHFGEVVQVRKNTFIVSVGEMRAIITVDPAKPNQIIVLSVYRADEGRAEERETVDSAPPEGSLAEGR